MKIFFILILSVFLCSEAYGDVASGVNNANKLYREGKYKEAQIDYLDLLNQKKENDIINYNLANALYQNEQFGESVTKYRKALLTDNSALRDKVRYNLANALFYHGLAIEKQDIDQAIESLTKTLAHYDELRISNQDDEKVAFNYPIVERELERMKQQQMMQQNQQNSSDNSEQNQKNSGNEEQNQNNKQEGQQPDNQQGQNQDGAQAQEKNGQDQQAQDQAASEGDPQSSNEQQPAAQPRAVRMQALTEDEAKMLLEDYEQNKDPKGIINFIEKRPNRRPVYQDW